MKKQNVYVFGNRGYNTKSALHAEAHVKAKKTVKVKRLGLAPKIVYRVDYGNTSKHCLDTVEVSHIVKAHPEAMVHILPVT